MHFDMELRRRWRRRGEQKDCEATETTWPPRGFADNQDTYGEAVASMFEGRAGDAEADLAKLLRPDFVMRSSGGTYDFGQFVAYADRMRAQKDRLAVRPVMFLRDGDKLAAQLVTTVRRPNGDTHRLETLQFAEVHADGRLARIVETVEARAPSWETYVKHLMRGMA